MDVAALQNLTGYLFNLERLPGQRISGISKKLTGEYRQRYQESPGWNKFLAHARARFLYDLTLTNNLVNNEDGAKILEIDDGRSKV